ncbi:hypothetical protein B296_00032584 [Ensete ventricosum]|uniref:Uncharacterized protein n=1 Tax=Ensete ventricosum TaxID=4639 RepID=A0A426YEE9_ENSVE|nr:hypothetical protein B296_00032584 [Ensete ventricosum]
MVATAWGRRGRRRLAGEDSSRYLFSFASPPPSSSFSSLLDFSSIDRRRSKSTIDSRLLAVPPGSGQSTYRSAAGPVHTERYGALPLVVHEVIIGLRYIRS